jgi:RNA polymerase sigma-70 factor, ECF subfamily
MSTFIKNNRQNPPPAASYLIKKETAGENAIEDPHQAERMERLEELYDLYANRLYGYLVSITSSHADAEDLLQELFIKLAKSNIERRKIRKPRNYLFRSARNLAISHIRKRAREKDNREKLEQLVEPKSDSGITKEEIEIMNAALMELSLEQREVLTLKIYEEMTFKQIAKLLEISANTAASRYRYALEKLKVFYQNRNRGKPFLKKGLSPGPPS